MGEGQMLGEAQMSGQAPSRTGAGFARGKSKQNYSTPMRFVEAVKKKFGVEFACDLAATKDNTKAKLYFGPDHPRIDCRDSLSPECSWIDVGEAWLNPPFSSIAPWATKCLRTLRAREKAAAGMAVSCIFLLVPAAVGSNWWRAYVHKKARVYFLNGRIPFDPAKPKWGYPKDCALVVYGEKPGYRVWDWRK